MDRLLSIVIANYNYGRFLEAAITSVVNQELSDLVEVIICDAASTDNSVDVIKKYANGLPPNTNYDDWASRSVNSRPNSRFSILNSPLITWWCSEKDGGQSAAFNKGFSHARGRFFTWLNADDVLLPGAVKKLSEAVKKYPSCEWFTGGDLWTGPDLDVIKCTRARSFSRYDVTHGMITVYSPSSFFARTLFNQIKAIREDFHYLMDIDLWFRFYFDAHAEYCILPGYVFALRLHPEAKVSGHNFQGSLLSDPSNPARLRRMEEARELSARYPHRINRFYRLLRLDWWTVLKSAVDTLRFRGKSINDILERLP